jgi:hypothetical protein
MKEKWDLQSPGGFENPARKRGFSISSSRGCEGNPDPQAAIGAGTRKIMCS